MPNTALWLSLFLDVHLHVQAAVFPCGILCVRYLFFLLKKKTHTLCFYCIITLLIIPSRGFSSCRNTAHTLRYCWHKNRLSKSLYPSTSTNLIFPKRWPLFQLGPDTSLTSPGDSWTLALSPRIHAGVTYVFLKSPFKTTLEVNDKSFKFFDFIFQGIWAGGGVGEGWWGNLPDPVRVLSSSRKSTRSLGPSAMPSSYEMNLESTSINTLVLCSSCRMPGLCPLGDNANAKVIWRVWRLHFHWGPSR